MTAPNGSSQQRITASRAPQPVTADQVSEIVREEITAEFRQWSGPLPHPDDLAAFNRVVPGSAESIVEAFIAQSNHRRELEKLVVSGSERRATRGQFLVYSVLLLTIIGGLVVALKGEPLGGAALTTAGLGSGIALYILGGRTPKDE